MKEDNIEEPWHLFPPIHFLILCIYLVMSRFMAVFNISRAFLLNAEFDDYAKHIYAQFVKEHPE